MLKEGRDDGVKGVGRTELGITPKRADPQLSKLWESWGTRLPSEREVQDPRSGLRTVGPKPRRVSPQRLGWMSEEGRHRRCERIFKVNCLPHLSATARY